MGAPGGGGGAAGSDAAPRRDAASGGGGAGEIDAAVTHPDAAAGEPDAAGAADAATGPYRHTITVDGESSFTAAETFATTTASFTAYLTWDDDNLYVGYQGSDVTAGDAARWLLVYIDSDPGGPAGTGEGERYNTETPRFPSGFAADYYVRWQSSGAVEDLKAWDGQAWQTTDTQVAAATGGPMLEVALPRAALGDPATLGVTLLWLNEADQVEAAYGGLYPDSFIDGYHATVPVGRYLAVDFASPAAPNAPANRRP